LPTKLDIGTDLELSITRECKPTKEPISNTINFAEETEDIVEL